MLNQSPVQKGIETYRGCQQPRRQLLNQSPVQKGIETLRPENIRTGMG